MRRLAPSRWVRARSAAALLAGGCVAVVVAGCRPDSVRVSFRPPVGARYRYEVTVHSVTTTRLQGAATDRSVDDATLLTDQLVLSSGPGDVRVQLRLRRQGSPDRTFVVRLDRGAQLAGVEAVEGLPPSVLAPDALPQLLPGGSAAPPNRPLSPGERWTIDAPAGPLGAPGTRLVGSGRLVELGLSDGRKVASTAARTRVPVATTQPLGAGTLALDGVESNDGTATRDVTDGAVQRATSVTLGEFRVTLLPAEGSTAGPVRGTLTIEVRSDTRRVG